MMRDWSFLAGMFGAPVMALALGIAWLTPAYVPSDTLMAAATSTASVTQAQRRILASFVGRCHRDWALSPERLNHELRLYSWENDAGVLARTEIACIPGAECSVTAHALLGPLFPRSLGGKPFPRSMRNCGRAMPDWSRDGGGGELPMRR